LNHSTIPRISNNHPTIRKTIINHHRTTENYSTKSKIETHNM
jgi:hypothetical protein